MWLLIGLLANILSNCSRGSDEWQLRLACSRLPDFDQEFGSHIMWPYNARVFFPRFLCFRWREWSVTYSSLYTMAHVGHKMMIPYISPWLSSFMFWLLVIIHDKLTISTIPKPIYYYLYYYHLWMFIHLLWFTKIVKVWQIITNTCRVERRRLRGVEIEEMHFSFWWTRSFRHATSKARVRTLNVGAEQIRWSPWLIGFRDAGGLYDLGRWFSEMRNLVL